MPGIVSWIKGRLQPAPPAKTAPDRAAERPAEPELKATRPGYDPSSQAPEVKLKRHLLCWLLDAGPRDLARVSPLTEDVLKEVCQRLDDNALVELPRQPLTLPTLMRTLGSESTTRKEITQIILSDPSLTNQVLQVANSPFFKVGDQIVETVDQAVFLLGLDGIRNVVSASVMRPMLAARNSTESAFSQRVWRWGLSCARAAELIAQTQKEETTSHFMVGLLPSLAYLTLRREVQTIMQRRFPDQSPTPQLYCEVMYAFEWETARKIARDWNLPDRYLALMTPTQSTLTGNHTPLDEGIILGTREVLRDARQRNLGEDELRQLLTLSPGQLDKVRRTLSKLLEEGLSSG